MSSADVPTIARWTLTTRRVRFLATPSFRPFLFMMRHRCVQTSFAGFLRWFISDLHFRVMTMSGVPSRRTIFMPWPGKMLNSLNAHLSYLTTILRGSLGEFPRLSRVSLSLSLSAAAARRCAGSGSAVAVRLRAACGGVERR